MIHLKKEKRRTKALVRDYIGKTVFLRREVSIPILRVGVQQMKKEAISKLISVSIPILRVGVQPDGEYTVRIRISFNSHTARGSSTTRALLTILKANWFQFPYCAWEFNKESLVSC